MVDDLSGESSRGGVLGSRHGPTNICAAVRSMLGKNGGRTTMGGRTGSCSRAVPSRGVASLMVCAVGVSASDRVGSWKSMVSSLGRRVTRSRSRGVDSCWKAGHGSENGIGSPRRTAALSSSSSNHVGACERNKDGKEVLGLASCHGPCRGSRLSLGPCDKMYTFYISTPQVRKCVMELNSKPHQSRNMTLH